MLRRLKDQRGVAAITVLMVTAVTALAGATVLFTATAELEIGARDRRSEDAFAAAEGGLDRAAAALFADPSILTALPDPGPGLPKVKCLNNPLVNMADVCDEISITSPTNGALFFPPGGGKPFVQYDVLSRAREGRTVARVLASRFRLDPKEIPYGLFINGNVDLNGGPKLLRISMLVNGVVTSRDKIDTDGDGPGPLTPFNSPDLGWRFHKDRIKSNPPPNVTCTDPSLPPSANPVGCVGVFSNFQIFRKNAEKASDEVHSCSPACYPNDRDSHTPLILPPPPDPTGKPQQVVTLPDTDVLEAMEGMEQLARQQGNYMEQFKNGSNDNIVINPADIGAPGKNFGPKPIFYIVADAGDQIKWRPSLIPNSTSSDVTYINDAGDTVGSLSGVIVVRGGQLDIEAGTDWSGALFAPENKVRLLGSNTCTCTIYAKAFEKVGGSATVQLTADWFNNLPGGWYSVRRESFVECEPYEPSALCPAV